MMDGGFPGGVSGANKIGFKVYQLVLLIGDGEYRLASQIETGDETLNSQPQHPVNPVPVLVGILVIGIAAYMGYAVINNVQESDPTEPSASTDEAANAESVRDAMLPVSTFEPSVVTPLKGKRGEAVTLSCNTCHATRPPNVANRRSVDMDEFHQGIQMKHGDQSCLSCHDARNYDRLHLADGQSLAFVDTMKLCAQCHGPQFRDYKHGAHGGMTGFWDTTKGSRQRNHCVDCHDPHSPAYPMVMPAPGPRDRQMKPRHHGSENGDRHD